MKDCGCPERAAAMLAWTERKAVPVPDAVRRWLEAVAAQAEQARVPEPTETRE